MEIAPIGIVVPERAELCGVLQVPPGTERGLSRSGDDKYERFVQLHGGYGYIDEYPVSKYLRDARVMTLYEGTSQIQKLLIGRKLTGINAFTG